MPSNGTALNPKPADINSTQIGKPAELWLKPMSSAWEADALPLDDTRKMLGLRRFYSQTV